MKSNRLFVVLGVACLTAACAVATPGCDSGSGEIPLAKVPPPPEGFNAPGKTKPATGGSPTDANAMRR
jgi:hypothetical protein